MRVTFLGTGTSHGIPMIGCGCGVCRSTDPRNRRLRPSIFVETAAVKLLVDAPPDFRTQALRAGIPRLDAVLLTHTHADHILGLDDLRAFTERQNCRMPIYTSAESVADVQRIFSYACTPVPRWPGLPSFDLRAVAEEAEFTIGDLPVRSLPVPHGRMTVLGFLLGGAVAYLTDCNAVPAAVVAAIRGVPVLVLDALRHRPHPTHLTVAQALAVIAEVQPRQAWLTHLCHELDHQETEARLPATVRIAYDGLQLEVNGGEVRILD